MAPNDSKSIPSWQRATSLPGAEDVSATKPLPAAKPDETESTHEVPRKEEKKSKDDVDDVREEAFRFLNDPSIKNATRERKAAFLESKGLKKEDIELLMSSLDAQPVVKLAPPPPPPQAPREVPPVITYPEFLVHSQKPPPLVTKTLIVNTLYATAGIYGTLYALSKYIINPMQAQLSESRHDLLTHSTTQLDLFNTRLSEIVSKVPASRPGTANAEADHPDDASDDSDPTELFHRDFGTQTSPSLSRRNSSSTESDSPTPDATKRQESQLKSMIANLKDLSSSSESTNNYDDDTSQLLSQLTASLSSMAFNSSYYKYNSGGYNWGGGKSGVSEGRVDEDEVDRMTRDIKSLKGQFLGVRNFPRAGVR